MPQIPKNIVAFKAAPDADNSINADNRINLDTVYTDSGAIEKDLAFQIPDIKEFLKEEYRHNAIYLQTLSRMLADKGYDISAEKLFMEPHMAGGYFSSPPVIALVDYANASVIFQRSRVGPPESTTRYDIIFNIDYRQLEKDTEFGCPIGCPTYKFDAAAIRLLLDKGVAKSEMEKWFQGFMKMALLAEHDGDAHQLLLNKIAYGSRVDFADDEVILGNSGKLLNIPPSITAQHMEDHAQSLHAQVMAEMFRESPKRKTHALRYAKESFLQLQKIQVKALAACKSDEESARVNEAITYLAEVYSHRLFRVFWQGDEDLRSSGVTEAMDGLVLRSAKRKCDVTGHGLDVLAENCAVSMGPLYDAIHRKDSFPIIHITYKNGEATATRSEQVSALEFIGKLYQELARLDKEPEQFRRTHAERANRMREAIALHKEHKHVDARKIERELRNDAVNGRS